MYTHFEFLTEETPDLTTEEIELKLFEGDTQSLDLVNSIKNVTPINMVEESAMAITIFSLGMLLNIIILRVYWKDKSATSTYFRAFAVIDVSGVAILLIRQFLLVVWTDNTDIRFVGFALTNLFAGLYNFCPMFLGMDRCLIVSFPHNFREHEGKLRVAKGSMVLVVTTLSLALSMLYRLDDPGSTATVVLEMLAFIVAVLQIITIVVLYAIIVVKVLMSDRKMKTSRHIGNK